MMVKTLLTPMSFQISFCETLKKILGEMSVFFSSFCTTEVNYHQNGLVLQNVIFYVAQKKVRF